MLKVRVLSLNYGLGLLYDYGFKSLKPSNLKR